MPTKVGSEWARQYDHSNGEEAVPRILATGFLAEYTPNSEQTVYNAVRADLAAEELLHVFIEPSGGSYNSLLTTIRNITLLKLNPLDPGMKERVLRRVISTIQKHFTGSPALFVKMLAAAKLSAWESNPYSSEYFVSLATPAPDGGNINEAFDVAAILADYRTLENLFKETEPFGITVLKREWEARWIKLYVQGLEMALEGDGDLFGVLYVFYSNGIFYPEICREIMADTALFDNVTRAVAHQLVTRSQEEIEAFVTRRDRMQHELFVAIIRHMKTIQETLKRVRFPKV